jgi:hypothetical protein
MIARLKESILESRILKEDGRDFGKYGVTIQMLMSPIIKLKSTQLLIRYNTYRAVRDIV